MGQQATQTEASKSYAIAESGVMLVGMCRGPTGLVQRLRTLGVVSDQLLQAAQHEADLLEHPVIGLEHLKLGCLTLQGRVAERDALRKRISVGAPRGWERVRGHRSVRRRRG